MGMRSLAMIIISAVAIYSLRDDTDDILACALGDYLCVFPKLANFALVLGILLIASRCL